MKTRSQENNVDPTNMDDFPPLSAALTRSTKSGKKQDLTNETEAPATANGKKLRPNGTTPKKQEKTSIPQGSSNKETTVTMPVTKHTKCPPPPTSMPSTGSAKGNGPTPPTEPHAIDLTSPNENDLIEKDNISPAASALARNLDKALMNAETNVETIHPLFPNATDK
jgi:hypothetical protein